MDAEVRNRSYVEYEIPYTPAEARRRVDALPPVHVRGDRLLRPAPARDRVRHDAPDARAAVPPGRRLPLASPRTASPASTTTTSATTRHAFILREPSRCIDCGRCAQVCAEVVGAACYDFMRIGFDTLVTTPLDMSLNDTPCVSCGRCAETCPTGALDAEAARPREVRGRRVALHPVRHLRRRLPLRRAPRRRRHRALAHRPRRADDRPAWRSPRSTARPRSRTSGASATGRRGRRPRAGWSTGRLLPMLPASVAGDGGGNGHGHGHGHGGNGHDAWRARPGRHHGTPRSPAAPLGRAERARRGDRRHDPVHVDPLDDDVLFVVFAADDARRGAARRDDARHHPLRPGDDGLLRRAGRDLRAARARRSSPPPRCSSTSARSAS